MNLLLAYIKLLRPLNVFISGMVVVLSSAVLGVLNETDVVIHVVMVVSCYTGAANALNDMVDYKIDLINCPERPIPSGLVSKNAALLIFISLFSFGTYFCLELSQNSKVIGIGIAMPLMVLYSKSLKGIPLIGNITIALILGMSFLFCGSAHGNIGPMWLPMALAFGLTLVRELVKDIADIGGDRYVGMSTYPIVVGMDKAIRLAILLSILIGIGAILPYLSGTYGLWYGILLILGVEIPLAVVVFLFLYNPGISSAIKGARILKFSTLMGLIAIYAGT